MSLNLKNNPNILLDDRNKNKYQGVYYTYGKTEFREIVTSSHHFIICVLLNDDQAHKKAK